MNKIAVFSNFSVFFLFYFWKILPPGSGSRNAWRYGCFEKMDHHPVHTTVYTNPLPYQTKWMFFQNLFYKTSLLQNSWCFQICPPNHSDDICLLFCLYPSSVHSPSKLKGNRKRINYIWNILDTIVGHR